MLFVKMCSHPKGPNTHNLRLKYINLSLSLFFLGDFIEVRIKVFPRQSLKRFNFRVKSSVSIFFLLGPIVN